ncbi:hypothetical protein B9Z19DRAFT_379985 [Tuber borchii]|uniref:Uncharacterized protein n=1 Tax=Tuber borchii TaxID=42251 RepID=A0A2T6ZHM0_TUBBO|nr:hypothetical protein B9Z19DRAFT_379985 [Tuber borchii]
MLPNPPNHLSVAKKYRECSLRHNFSSSTTADQNERIAVVVMTQATSLHFASSDIFSFLFFFSFWCLFSSSQPHPLWSNEAVVSFDFYRLVELATYPCKCVSGLQAFIEKAYCFCDTLPYRHGEGFIKQEWKKVNITGQQTLKLCKPHFAFP